MTSRTFHIRRKDKEVTDSESLVAIIREATVCHLALIDEDEPYVVPVNFGFEDNCIYFHSAVKGRKVDIIRKNNRVCFNIVTGVKIVDLSPKICKTNFKSVTGVGSMQIIEDPQEKIHGLKAIMWHNLGHELEIPPERLESTLVVRIDIKEIKGKQGV